MKRFFTYVCCILSSVFIIFQTQATEIFPKNLGPVREIVFDIETTGRSLKTGDKIVEIGAIELINHIPTGKTYLQYINPKRDMPEEAFQVHGLSTEFLSQYPAFSEVAQDFLDFVGDDSILIAHNGIKFDVPFLNYELEQNGFKTLENHEVIDTLEIAKNKFPEEPHNLDYLCLCLNVDNSERVKHDALLDAEILAEVYLKLINEAPSICPSEIIKQAITEKKKLEMVYEDRNKKVTTRTIIPNKIEYGKVFNEEGEEYHLKDKRVYIKAYCELAQDNRTFRLDRIKQIAIVNP